MIKLFLTSKTEKLMRQVKWRQLLIITLGIVATILLASFISLYTYKL